MVLMLVAGSQPAGRFLAFMGLSMAAGRSCCAWRCCGGLRAACCSIFAAWGPGPFAGARGPPAGPDGAHPAALPVQQPQCRAFADPRRAPKPPKRAGRTGRVLPCADARQPGLVPLADEIALCRQYLDLEKLRLGDRLKVVWQIDDLPGELLVPPLMLQPLLEKCRLSWRRTVRDRGRDSHRLPLRKGDEIVRFAGKSGDSRRLASGRQPHGAGEHP